ncbi:polysaccharide biosynthesis tyrosine autokinase [Anaeromyxobacter terrae]|uniref:polysaccharide biosynthesis tyrosine autokinase n=1 Tax=Anaeromyxobacter terrae TaxID=2925406 RepID=UPI001F566C21|nr:polysaccharide biosynthesis tyrosine autokinase [Anaeromyxobacter sp. SG22]
MSNDRAKGDAVVEVNFGAATLRDLPPPQSALAPRSPPSLVEVLHTLAAERWLIAGVLLAALALSVAYLFVATPIYESNLVLQIEERSKKLTGLEDLSDFMAAAASPAETEIEIIRSRSLIGGVVDELGLDVEATPRRAPLLGAALARRWRGAGPAPARFGLERYGWGGERIDLSRLEVGEDLVDDTLVLTALEGGRYRIGSADEPRLLEAAVGSRASGGEGARSVEIVVHELVARPGTQFLVTKHDRAGLVSRIRRALGVQESGRKTGILVATLEGPEPQRVTFLLNAIGRAYLRRNVERKSAEAAQMLSFLESQLPVLKSGVDAAEVALNAFQKENRLVDISQEAEAMLERAVRIEGALQELQLQATDLRQRFTENHPAIVAIQQKIARMQGERAALDQQMRALPGRELDSVRLARDVKVASELYVLVLNKAQELKVARSGVVGNVAVLDAAEVPRRPSSPQRGQVLSLALILGLGLGVGIALVRKAFDEGAVDPDEIEARTGLPVYVMIPHSEVEARLDRDARRVPGSYRAALTQAAPDDLAIEGLRSLRTALQFALVEARNNVIALGAPSPAVGKSFISVNLAHLLAAAGRRVLLVDGDLRRGRLHRYFSLERTPGLSDVVSGATPLEQALRRTLVERLDLLSTGRIPPNPAELLASHRFQALLAELSERYDLVIVDTPPVLAVTDPTLVARHAGVNLLVLRAAAHSVHEIALAVKQLGQAGVRVQGAILNEMAEKGGRYGRSGRYHRYEYRSETT